MNVQNPALYLFRFLMAGALENQTQLKFQTFLDVVKGIFSMQKMGHFPFRLISTIRH